MNTTPKDGGPAFPRATTLNPTTAQPWNDEQQGMSLRVWLAGIIMQGIAASETENYGFTDQYMGTDGKPTYRKSMYPFKDGKEDYSQSPVQLPLFKTKYQQEAELAYARADALLALQHT